MFKILRKNNLVGTAVDPTDFATKDELEAKQDKLEDKGTYTEPTDSNYLSGLFMQGGKLSFKSLTLNALWTWIVGENCSKSISSSSTDFEIPTAKAVVDYAQKKLYCHNMMLRFNDGNRKLKVSLITSRADDYTVADLTAYLKAKYSSTNANITGNLAGIIPGCMGYYKDAGGNWYDMLGLVYCTDYNAVCPVGRLQTATASNQLTVLNSHAGTYTVTDNVVPLSE